MTPYELYINDELCTLDKEEDVALVYQSPIFSGLDAIQSNRSYTIDLPLALNRKVIANTERPDVESDVPYRRLPAKLYQGGIPLFLRGFSTITEISDVISNTLTWGNVENFQPLFDNDMSALSDILYDMGLGSIPWNEDSKLLNISTHACLGFFAIDYGRGLTEMQYIHPAIHIKPVIEAIERFNGITIADKERLYERAGLPTDAYIFPLVSKNGNPESNYAERITARPEIEKQSYAGFARVRFSEILHNPDLNDRRDLVQKGDYSDYINVADYNETRVLINNYDTAQDHFELILPKINSTIPTPGFPDKLFIRVKGRRESDNEIVTLYITYSYQKLERTYSFDNVDIKIDTTDIINLWIEISNVDDTYFPSVSPFWPEWKVEIVMPWDDIIFPTIFPVGPNLPDMSQGDFLSALLVMNGLFAYADKDKPDTIGLISADEFYDNITSGKYLDWSDKVVLNPGQDASRPDGSEFTVEDYAQRNTIDYDNDDEVLIDTSGEILIENKTLERENDTDIPFSASINISKDGYSYAKIPIYSDDENASYSECTPRIVSWYILPASTKPYVFGRFETWQKFGGEDGIIATRYKGLQRILRQLRIVSVRLCLSPMDLADLDYRIPVYFRHLGRFFAIYTIETRNSGICECKFIRL